MDWFIRNKKKQIDRLKQETQLPPFLAILLGNRDLEPNQVEAFLQPSLDHLEDPFAFQQMGTVVEYIIACLHGGIKIRIVGDYDQDGVAATTILVKGIRAVAKHLGQDPFFAVDYAIPDRIEDGYGINARMVDQALEEGCGLIITCDNGIAAFDALDHAQEVGLPVIITDHHQPALVDGVPQFPPAEAVINPNLSDPSLGLDHYPFPDLCGAGVAFKVIQALQESLGVPFEKIQPYLAYAALATICDMVPLKGENRVITSLGLVELNRLDNPGFRSLLKYSNWDREVTAYTAGFVIGPAINASGRLSTARLGVELFLEEDPEKADIYARELVDLNRDRQAKTQTGVSKALAKVKALPSLPQVLVLYLPNIHESICGLVAGKVKDQFYRPCLVFTDAENKKGLVKGSGRSIHAYNMFEKMNLHRDAYLSFGGHAMACGITVRKEDLPRLDKTLNQEAGLSPRDLRPFIDMDMPLNFRYLSYQLVETIDQLAPFGLANPRPVFGVKGVNLLGLRLVGREKNVLQLFLEQEGRRFQGVYFQAQEKLEAMQRRGETWPEAFFAGRDPGVSLDLVYQPDINEFRGKTQIQIKVKDFRLSQGR